MGSEEIDETPTGVFASGGDRSRLGQRNHQLVGFYERTGAVRVGEAPSDSAPAAAL